MIIFRCNSNPVIGFGHLGRCRVLADSLSKRGEKCLMAGPANKYRLPEDNKIFTHWAPFPQWESAEKDAKLLVNLAKKYSSQMVVLDDYRVDELYQLILRDAGIRWLQFDPDATKPLWADYIINANPEAGVDKYKKVVRNKDAKLLLGPKFAILRPEFQLQNLRKFNPLVKKILIIFGGGDDRGAILLILKALLSELSVGIKFLVISGKHNPRNQIIKEWVKDNGNERVEVQINPTLVAPLFLSTDLAIISGGSVVYEAASCGLPMMLISIEENQLWPARAWTNAEAAINLGELNSFDESFVRKSVSQVVNDKNKRKDLANVANKLCNGQGVKYISDLILS